MRELVGPRHRFAFADAGSTALKGLAEPVPVVEILGESTEVEAEPRTPAEPPYKGLVAFEPEDSGLFFGREATVAMLIDRLASARLLAVVGASGTGKSSVVRAGVVAALRRDALPGSSTWPTVLLSPGAHPLAELAAHLSLRAGVPVGSLLDDLAGEPRALDLAARQAAVSLPAGARVVVVIDQFEELFTLCRDECERGQFIDALVHAVTVDGGITTVVLAVRADFYGHCAAHAELARLLETGTALLGPMAGAEMAAAIDGPARVSGFRLEPGLPEVIRRDLADEPGALPLLSHALLETWKRRRGRMLTHRGYDDAGGVRSAIARTAESVYGRLDSAQQSLARNVFVRLTELGEGTADTRRRVAVVELSAGPDESERLASVLHTLAEARLVTLGEADVELAHEAIIGEWPRLRGWLDDDREGLRIHRHITHAAQDWEVLGRDAAELYRGPRLAAALEWADRTGDGDLNPLEREFLAAGRARQQQEMREHASQVRRLRRLLAGVGIALVAALVAGTLALVEQRRADDHADAARDATLRADVGRLVAESDNLSDRDRYLATLLALEAHRVADTAATRSAVLNALLAEPRLQATMSAGHGGYTAVSYVPPGRLVAARSADMLDFFDTRTGRPSGAPIELEPGDQAFAVYPDGSLVATGSRDGTVTLWDVETRTRRGPALTLGHNALGLTFSPDGERLVTLEGEYADTSPMATASSVHVWDVATREPVDLQLGGHTAAVNTAAFSPDGRILATGGNDARVVLHDAATGVALGPPLSVGSYVVSLSFSPDGTHLAVGTQQGESLIFDVATGAQLASLPGEGIVSKVAFSPDGRRIATFLNDAQVFDGTTFEPIGAPMDTHGGYSNGAFSPDGRTLAIAAFAGIVGLWDPDGQPRIAKPIPGSSPFGGTFSPDGKLIAVPDLDGVTLYSAATLAPVGPPLPAPAGPPAHGFPPVGNVAFSPDSRIVAVGGGAPTIQRYQVASLEPVGDPIRLDAPASDLAFSPDGDLLAIGSVLDTITLVDTEQGTQSPAHPLGRSTFTSVTFSPDGRRLVATSIGEGGAWVFDLTKENPTPEPLPATLDDVAVAAFSPDGSLAATGSEAGTVQFRDPRTFAPLGAPVPVAEGVVVNLAFSPDGGLLAAGDIKSLTISTTRLVDVATRQTVGEPQAGLPAVSPSFSPDGTTMATSSLSNTLLWSLDPVIWRERACEIAGRSLTDAEVRDYLPNNPEAPPTCAHFPRAEARQGDR